MWLVVRRFARFAYPGGVIVFGRDWIRVHATIVECFRAWEEAPRAGHLWFEVVADIKTPAGEVERVTARQKMHTLAYRWRPPDPGDVVPARWDPAQRKLRLELRGDPRYDEKVIKALGRTRQPPTAPPPAFGMG